MRLLSVLLDHCRGFEHLEVDFHERLTVLVGANGSGKTTLLEAIASLLGNPDALPVLHRFQRAGSMEKPSVKLRVLHDGKELVLHNRVEASLQDGAGGPVAVWVDGVFAFYRYTPRVESSPEAASVRQFGGSDLEGNTSFLQFFEWFREREEAENFQRSRRGDLTYWDPQLRAVREAAARLLPGTSDLHLERDPIRMVVQKDELLLGVGDLSDGEKRLLALCGDLAARLSRANPRSSAPLEEPGVVLLDEVELHLHPSWQRLVLGRLMQTFPGCQWVVSTHAPAVLAGVDPSSLRLLDRFRVANHEGHTRGRNVDALLREVMGVPERPEETTALIQGVARMIDEDRFQEARAALVSLTERLGPQDTEVIRLGALISFLEGELALLSQGA